jgi:hypothetical protein
MLNGGRDGSVIYLVVNLQFCYGYCCLIKKMLWYFNQIIKIERQTRRSMSFVIQMITNDLGTGSEQTSTETKCKCHFLLKLLLGLGIALPL